MIYCSSLDIIFFERRRKKYNHERLLDMEIVALQSEVAKFSLAEVLEKRWSIFYCTIREVQGPVWPRAARQIIVRSPRSIEQSVKSENISFLF